MAFFSEREVRLARSFIKATGGNEKNGYLLLAVIAWQRAMTKNRETFWKSLSKYTAFRAGQLLAARVKRKVQLDYKSYGAILKTLRLGGTGDSNARHFLLAIAKSKWDRDHYGYKPFIESHMVTTKVWHQTSASGGGYWETKYTWVPVQEEYNPLEVQWQKLTGHNVPKKYFVDTTTTTTTTKPRREPPRQPRSLVHVMPEPDYIGPYEARDFYAARKHLGDNILADF